MCAVSMIMDYGRRDFWPNQQPGVFPPQYPSLPQPNWPPQYVPPLPPQTDELKLREFLKLYEAAKAYDRETAQPDCEDPEKTQVLQRILERLDEIEKRLPAA